MNLFKIITIIVAVWLILKIKRFISGAQIKTAKSVKYQKEKSSRTAMDIQDADYEDLE